MSQKERWFLLFLICNCIVIQYWFATETARGRPVYPLLMLCRRWTQSSIRVIDVEVRLNHIITVLEPTPITVCRIAQLHTHKLRFVCKKRISFMTAEIWVSFEPTIRIDWKSIKTQRHKNVSVSRKKTIVRNNLEFSFKCNIVLSEKLRTLSNGPISYWSI